MKIGVDYYPEQWDRSLWEKDAALMAQTGVKVVRIAEFAWSRIEPKDGVFEFQWLDDVIAVLQRFGICRYDPAQHNPAVRHERIFIKQFHGCLSVRTDHAEILSPDKSFSGKITHYL